MEVTRSLGGIGRLYHADQFLGEVYYNIPQDQPPGRIACSMVFVGNDLELTHHLDRYSLYLEDGRYLIIMLSAARLSTQSPYACLSCDGIWHSELSFAHL